MGLLGTQQRWRDYENIHWPAANSLPPPPFRDTLLPGPSAVPRYRGLPAYRMAIYGSPTSTDLSQSNVFALSKPEQPLDRPKLPGEAYRRRTTVQSPERSPTRRKKFDIHSAISSQGSASSTKRDAIEAWKRTGFVPLQGSVVAGRWPRTRGASPDRPSSSIVVDFPTDPLLFPSSTGLPLAAAKGLNVRVLPARHTPPSRLERHAIPQSYGLSRVTCTRGLIADRKVKLFHVNPCRRYALVSRGSPARTTPPRLSLCQTRFEQSKFPFVEPLHCFSPSTISV